MRKSLQGSAACRGLVCGGLFILGGFVSSPLLAQDFLVMQATCGSILTQGEGTRKGLEDYVEISSFHHGVANNIVLGSTGGGGKVTLDTFRVAKPVSGSSIGLVDSLVNGKQCQEIRIERWGADPGTGESVQRWRVVASSVFVEERKEWHAGSDGPAEESLGFVVAEQIEWTYIDAKGGELSTSWNFLTLSAE